MYLHRGRHVPGWRIWLGHRSLAGHRFETLCSFLPTFCVCPSLRWRPCWTRRMTWTKRQTTQLPSNLLQCKGQLFSAVPSSQCRWIPIHCLDSCHVNKNKNPWKLACDGIGTNTSWCTETWRSLTSPPHPSVHEANERTTGKQLKARGTNRDDVIIPGMSQTTFMRGIGGSGGGRECENKRRSVRRRRFWRTVCRWSAGKRTDGPPVARSASQRTCVTARLAPDRIRSTPIASTATDAGRCRGCVGSWPVIR